MPQPSHARNTLVGFALICLGQLLMTWAGLLLNVSLGDALNTYYHLGFLYFNNVLLGGFVLLAGAALFGYSISGTGDNRAALSLVTMRLRFASLRLPVALLVVGAALFVMLLARLARLDDRNWLVAVWVGAQALFVAALVLRDQRSGVARAARLPPGDTALVAALCVAGLLVGTYQLDRIPRSLVGDEGRFWEIAQGIATGEFKPSLFDFGVYSYPVFSSFYQAGVLKLFGYSLWGWRFSSVLAGGAAIVPTYLLAHELFDRQVAVLAGVALIALPYALAFERLGYDNSQALLPVVLALYLLYIGLRHGSATWVGVGGIAAGYGFDTYTAGRLGLAVGVLFLGCSWANARRHNRRAAWAIVLLGMLFVAGWATAALPHIVYGTAKDPYLLRYKILESLFANVSYARTIFPEHELFRDYPPITVGSETLFYRPDLYIILLVRGFVRTLLVFQHNDLIHDHYIVGPLAGSLATLFYFCGLVTTCVRWRKQQSQLLLLWFGAGIALLSVLNTFPPRYQHMVPIIPVLVIFIAIGTRTVTDALLALFATHTTVARWALNSVVALALLVSGLQSYFVNAQAAYPPNAEHIMAFAALEARAPENMLYIYTEPQRKVFAPWIIQHLPTTITFQMVARDELLRGKYTFDARRTSIIFFDPDDQSAVVAYLAQLLRRPINPQPYFNREGQVIVLSYTFVLATATPPGSTSSE